MGALIRAFGRPIAATLILLVALWGGLLVAIPQAAMLDFSLWSRSRVNDISAEIDRTWTQLSTLEFDRAAAAPPRQAEIDAEMAELKTRIAELEKGEYVPPKVYGLQNYTRMSGLHLRIFVRTLFAAAFATFLSFLMCYPIACAVVFASTPGRAAALLTALVVPYAMNELLRVYAWMMILDYQGLVNGVLALFGIVDFARRDWVPFLEYEASVYLVMVSAYVLFMAFPIINTLSTLERAQIEAARDLGASTWRIHWRVILPHAKPGIAVGCVTVFMLAAGSYAVPQIITRGTGSEWFTQLVYRQFFGAQDWNIGSAYAFSLLAACLVFVAVTLRVFRVSLREITR